MSHRIRVLLLVGCFTAVAVATLGAARPRGSINGAYKVLVAGAFEGNGVATVGGRNLNINCEVRDSDGQRGRLRARLEVVDDHFRGQGEVLGQLMTISGHIDPPDRQGEVVRAARICANFAAGERHGRLVGMKQGGGN